MLRELICLALSGVREEGEQVANQAECFLEVASPGEMDRQFPELGRDQEGRWDFHPFLRLGHEANGQSGGRPRRCRPSPGAPRSSPSRGSHTRCRRCVPALLGSGPRDAGEEAGLRPSGDLNVLSAFHGNERLGGDGRTLSRPGGRPSVDRPACRRNSDSARPSRSGRPPCQPG